VTPCSLSSKVRRRTANRENNAAAIVAEINATELARGSAVDFSGDGPTLHRMSCRHWRHKANEFLKFALWSTEY